MAMQVPNPYAVGVAVGGPRNTSQGLVAAPDVASSKYNEAARLQQAGGEFSKALDQWQKEIDLTRAQDATNKLNQAALKLKYGDGTGQNGWVNQLGRNALERESGKSLAEENLDALKTEADAISKTLGNARQKAIFQDVFDATRTQMSQQIGAHTTRQFGIWQDSVDQETLESAIAQGMSTDETTREGGMAVSKAIIDKMYGRRGLKPDYSKGPGLIAAFAIDNLVDNGSPEAAQRYLDTNRDYMSPVQVQRAERLIAAGKEAAAVQRATEWIVSAQPESEAEARKMLKDVPERVRASVRTGIDRYFQDREDAQRAEIKEAREAAWGWIDEHGTLPPPSILEDLPAKERVSLKKKYNENGEIRKSSAEKTVDPQRVRKDPIRFAIDSGEYGFTPISDWQNLAAAHGEIAKRAARLDGLSETYGLIEPKILTGDELLTLKASLSAQDANAQVSTLQGLADQLPLEGVKVLASQLGKDYGNAVLLASDIDMRLDDVPRLYLSGRQGLKENQPKLKLLRDQTIGINRVAEQINGLYTVGAVRDSVLDTVLNVAAGLALEDGGTAGTPHLEKALETVVGTIYDYQGRRVALKDGADLSDLETSVRAVRDRLRGDKTDAVRTASGTVLDGDAFADIVTTSQLIPSGKDNQFFVAYGDQILLDMKGDPFVIDVVGGE